jgi:16S rRNA (uracil1498-N3)-methyltransferase
MNSPRFFCPEPIAAASCIALGKAAAHHVLRVLRLRPGEPLTLFDGRGGEYPGVIAAIDRDRVSVDVGAHSPVERESPLRLTLVQALQAGEKMDFTIQKAVELGVSRIVPVESRRGVVRLDAARATKRVEHWRGVVVAACEQCGRNRLPEVAPVETLERWLARPPAAGRRLFLSPAAELSLGALPPVDAVELLVGPEGGLAPEEVIAAQSAGYVPVRLGPRVLRTETAALAALAALHARWGDFV